jgi:glycosidase
MRRLKLAAVCHLTLDGTPIIYYGTEAGLSQAGDARDENAYARAHALGSAAGRFPACALPCGTVQPDLRSRCSIEV